MLVGCEFLAAAFAGMVRIVWLHEAVVGKCSLAAIVEKLRIGAEQLRLVFEKIYDLHRRAGRVEIVELGGSTGGDHTFIDAYIRRLPVKHIHADLSEGGAIVCEGAVADGRPGDGREPSVEDRVVPRQ